MTRAYRYAGADVIVGGIMGVLGATMNQSASQNMLTSASASLIGSAISTHVLKSQNRFFSSDTALSTVMITGSSVLSHMITDALIHKHHKPTVHISVEHPFGTTCDKQDRSWAERTEAAPQDTVLTR